MIPLNLIETSTTFYVGEDGKKRAVVFEEHYRQLVAASHELKSLASAAEQCGHGAILFRENCECPLCVALHQPIAAAMVKGEG